MQVPQPRGKAHGQDAPQPPSRPLPPAPAPPRPAVPVGGLARPCGGRPRSPAPARAAASAPWPSSVGSPVPRPERTADPGTARGPRGAGGGAGAPAGWGRLLAGADPGAPLEASARPGGRGPRLAGRSLPPHLLRHGARSCSRTGPAPGARPAAALRRLVPAPGPGIAAGGAGGGAGGAPAGLGALRPAPGKTLLGALCGGG